MSKKQSFSAVDPGANFPQLEQEISKYWKENKIFEKSVTSRPENKRWTFLDGPPFVTGTPHYGSLLSSLPKDLFGRYWTMKGYRVRRVWGWDGHGLPIENKVEGVLDVKRKKDIEDTIGVKKFVEECKKYVNEISAEWEWYVDRIGRWVDFKHAYKTWDINYMESVMWVFKQMYDKGYIYKGLRVSMYCPHCATPISNFEVAMDSDNYKEIIDAATTYKYELKEEKETFILAWSTTPWNKIVTVALAVNPKITYVKVKQNGQKYILAQSTLKMLEGKYEILEKFKGEKLIGSKFVPHYDYFKIDSTKKAFEVIGGDFVTADEGTGVVTIAAYGEEDLKVMQEQGIHIEIHLDEEGTIEKNVPLFGGMYFLKANKAVNEDLEKRGLIYKDEELPHSVPLCWRCHTRLYFAPLDAWFVNAQSIKYKMKNTNEKVNWFPKHFKYGRFLKSLENAPDWNISRNRYWGSPVPVWECECSERFVPGSIKELEEASGVKIIDLHKPEIDEVLITCKKCGKKVKRVPEVLDSWIEAGSASFAERHFPFEKAQKLEDFFPPDFIAEYTGQIRAWFYVLHVIGAAIYDSIAFKNVVVEGVILGTDGRKMSKNYGNYPDPKELLQKYGGDALRLYLMGSPVMHGEDILISEEQYKLQVRGLLLILWNIYNFFVTYAIADNWLPNETPIEKSDNVLDGWILSLTNELTKNVTQSLENYDTVTAIAKCDKFINSFSTWYIRRSRDRVGPTAQNGQDKESFYQTCFFALTTLCKLLAPIMPFITEEIYRNLTGEESVHLANWPQSDEKQIDKSLEDQMAQAALIVEKAHALRKEAKLKVRQPLEDLTYSGKKLDETIEELISAEVNVKKVIHGKTLKLNTKISPKLKSEGQARDIIRDIQIARKAANCDLSEKVTVKLPSWPKDFEDEIKKQTLAEKLIKSNKIEIVKS